MKAIVKTKMALGAELMDIAIPTPKPDEVLVKIKATSICGTDVHIFSWDSAAQIYIKKVPQILGHEFAGEIVEIGKKIKKFRVGDFVSAETHFFCGKCVQCKNGQKHICGTKKGKIFGLSCDGCFAEYATVPEKILWKNHPQLRPEIATLQEPLGNAVYCALGDYDKNLIGKTVLIIGDGPTAILASGVCKAEGAYLTAIVGRHEKRLEIASQMGANWVMKDGENIEETISNTMKNKGFDVVLEMAGGKKAKETALKYARNGGRISLFGIDGEPLIIENSGQFVRSAKKILPITGRLIWKTWKEVKRLLESGLLDPTPVITHKFSLEEFEKGFRVMTERPKVSGKVILIP